MRVIVAQQMSGLRNGKPWPGPGEVIDLPKDEAVDYLNAGICTAVEDKPKTEKATNEPKATTRKAPAKRAAKKA